jgi:predicted porin
LQQLSIEGKAGGAIPAVLGSIKEEKQSMNKKLMAVAVAGALGVPAVAMAQAQIYGRANLGVDRYQATGSPGGSAVDLKSRWRIYDSASRVGFRGTEDLGGGLRAVFSIETGVNVDNGGTTGQGGQANTSSGTWGSRDSWLGLEGSSWGRISAGRQSMFWTNGTIAQTGANYVNTDVPMATVGGGFGRVPGIGTRFNNSLMYSLPNLSGFGGYVGYAAQSEGQQGSTTTDPNSNTIAIRGTYEGIVKVQLDYGQNKGQTGSAVTTQGKIVGTKLGVGWPYMPGAQISLIVGSNQVTISNTGTGQPTGTAAVAGFSAVGDKIKQRAVVVNWEQLFGNIQALAMIGRLNKATGCSGTGCDNTEATSYLVGGRYLFSKRTAAYLTYNATTNKDNQVLDYTAAGITSANTLSAAPGADPKVIALGVIHNF